LTNTLTITFTKAKIMDKNILDLDDDKSNDGKDLSMSYVLTDALFILNSNYLNVLMSAINDEVDINVKTRQKR
jgi:hypothetical protein